MLLILISITQHLRKNDLCVCLGGAWLYDQGSLLVCLWEPLVNYWDRMGSAAFKANVFNFFLSSLGATPSGIQGFLLALHSRIIPGGA